MFCEEREGLGLRITGPSLVLGSQELGEVYLSPPLGFLVSFPHWAQDSLKASLSMNLLKSLEAGPRGTA